jgi:mRNA-degrading endonuclease YafQ of YafQ-DinJ toxin-antitoxin module
MRSPQNIDYSSYTQKDDKRPLIFDFFSQRLVLYFHKIGVANIFSENDLKEISLESQDITQSKLKNLISEAIEKGWKLEIQYFAKSNEYRGMFRIIKPYKLEKDHLLAYCYLRDDNRMFLLNRIGSVSTVKD